MSSSKAVFLGIKGSVIALDATTGLQIWATHLKGADFVHIVLDGDNLYAATSGEIFCLNPTTGESRWHNPLKGYGHGLCGLATESVPPAALLALLAEERRRQGEAEQRRTRNS